IRRYARTGGRRRQAFRTDGAARKLVGREVVAPQTTRPFYYPEFLVIPYPMAEKFSARLRRRGERIWGAIDGHPFLQELHAGTLGEIVAAVLPCYWIYGEVGRRLYRNRPSKPKIYRQWIETYASEAFWKPVREQIRLTDKLGAAASSSEKKLMTAHFILSSRY